MSSSWTKKTPVSSLCKSYLSCALPFMLFLCMRYSTGKKITNNKIQRHSPKQGSSNVRGGRCWRRVPSPRLPGPFAAGSLGCPPLSHQKGASEVKKLAHTTPARPSSPSPDVLACGSGSLRSVSVLAADPCFLVPHSHPDKAPLGCFLSPGSLVTCEE